MSIHLNNIFEKHNQISNLQVVFLDIEKYSKRKTNNQVAIINTFTKLLEEALIEVAKLNLAFIQKNNINFSTDIITIPTGDGAAVVFSFDGLHKVHLIFAELFLETLRKLNVIDECQKFEEQGWCNCHNKLNVRIGITEGKGVIYKDMNGNYNVAGNVINIAARLLSIAERNQIFLNEEAYKQLIDMEENPNFSDNFIEVKNVGIKHGIDITIYIYNPNKLYINGEIPKKLTAIEKIDALKDQLKSVVHTMDKETSIGELSSIITSFFETTQSLVETSPNEKTKKLASQPKLDSKATIKKTRRGKSKK